MDVLVNAHAEEIGIPFRRKERSAPRWPAEWKPLNVMARLWPGHSRDLHHIRDLNGPCVPLSLLFCCSAAVIALINFAAVCGDNRERSKTYAFGHRITAKIPGSER